MAKCACSCEQKQERKELHKLSDQAADGPNGVSFQRDTQHSTARASKLFLPLVPRRAFLLVTAVGITSCSRSSQLTRSGRGGSLSRYAASTWPRTFLPRTVSTRLWVRFPRVTNWLLAILTTSSVFPFICVFLYVFSSSRFCVKWLCSVCLRLFNICDRHRSWRYRAGELQNARRALQMFN